MGRRSKLTPKLQEEICAKIAQGLPVETAAAGAGVSTSALYQWIRRGKAETFRLFDLDGEEDDSPRTAEVERMFLVFAHAVEVALGESEERLLASIEEVALGKATTVGEDGEETTVEVRRDWKAGAWLLRMRRPDRYAERQQVSLDSRVELSGSVETDGGEGRAKAKLLALLGRVAEQGALPGVVDVEAEEEKDDG